MKFILASINSNHDVINETKTPPSTKPTEENALRFILASASDPQIIA